MKKLLIILSIITLVSCKKEKLNKTLYNSKPELLEKHVYGNVKAVNGCIFIIYQDLGNGFEKTNEFHYSNEELNVSFFDTIKAPFYFYSEIHNTSFCLSNGDSLKGDIGIKINYKDQEILNLKCDSLTESIEYTSIVYNN